MKSLRILVAAVLLASLGTACSSDKSTPSSGDAASACQAYCTKTVAGCSGADAGEIYPSVSECSTTECGSMPTASECQAPITSYYNCRSAAANLCNIASCKTELSAVPSTCR